MAIKKSELNVIYSNMEKQAGSKAHKEASPEEAAQRRKEGRTRGKKGAKMDRINMTFNSDNYEYLRIMGGLKGLNRTQFCNEIIAEHRAQHEAEYEQALKLNAMLSNKPE